MRSLPTFDDPNLIVGVDHFSDASVYRLRDDLLIVQSLDFFPPLVDDPFLFGQIAAANSLSDVLTMGARPVTALNIVAFPDDQLDVAILSDILCGGAERVRVAGAVVAGGHTVRDVEIKYGLSVTGVIEPDQLLTNAAAKPGDRLVLTKPLGTGFVTTAFKAGKCPSETLKTATDSMVQLNSIGRDAAQATEAHAATDITGFGLAGHAGEMAKASGVTLCLDVDRFPLLPGAAEFLAAKFVTRASASNRAFAESDLRIEAGVDRLQLEFAFDPQTSGGLLLSVAPERAEELVDRARQSGATAARIVGEVREQSDVAVILQ